MHIYPIALVPRLYPKVWGGHRLQQWLAPHTQFELPLGEIWTVHGDLTIANGPYAGECLDSLWQRCRSELARMSLSDRFPLLLKWIDTSQWLSVQVHPDDVQARLIEANVQASGKVECWYVVQAECGGELIWGLKHGISSEEAVCLSGSDLLSVLHRQTVNVGDFLLVPAGCIHALGPGITVLEVQQSSDITYRFYDWDRVDSRGGKRKLHIAQARRAILDSQAVERFAGYGLRRPLGKLLTSNSYFAQELVSVNESLNWSPENLEIIVVLSGSGEICCGEMRCRSRSGNTVVIPACAREISIVADKTIGESLQIMRVVLPDCEVKQW